MGEHDLSSTFYMFFHVCRTLFFIVVWICQENVTHILTERYPKCPKPDVTCKQNANLEEIEIIVPPSVLPFELAFSSRDFRAARLVFSWGVNDATALAVLLDASWLSKVVAGCLWWVTILLILVLALSAACLPRKSCWQWFTGCLQKMYKCYLKLANI